MKRSRRAAWMSALVLWVPSAVTAEPLDRIEVDSSTSFGELRGLQQLTWRDTPRGLMLLRALFKENGLRTQERQVTYALMHQDRLRSGTAESAFRYILFELTSGWGVDPTRPLWILLGLIPLFAIGYAFAIILPSSKGALWRVWEKDRIIQKHGHNEPLQLSSKNCTAASSAVYFSFLSAFSIGWREFNIGNWIDRLNPGEYTLRGTGWTRTVSGIQSLISVYLLAMTMLTYFGRPFE